MDYPTRIRGFSQLEDDPNALIGHRIQLFEEDDSTQWGVINVYNPVTKRHCIMKEDGDRQWINLHQLQDLTSKTSPGAGRLSNIVPPPPEPPVPNKTKKTNNGAPSSKPMCADCRKPVNTGQLLRVNIFVFHQGCFRCSHCDKHLSPNPLEHKFIKENVYCIPHYNEFTTTHTPILSSSPRRRAYSEQTPSSNFDRKLPPPPKRTPRGSPPTKTRSPRGFTPRAFTSTSASPPNSSPPLSPKMPSTFILSHGFTRPKSASIDSGSMQKCVGCAKPTRPTESIIVERNLYHKTCFQCQQCDVMLTLMSYAGSKDNLYCKQHFNQMLKSKERPKVLKLRAQPPRKPPPGPPPPRTPPPRSSIGRDQPFCLKLHAPQIGTVPETTNVESKFDQPVPKTNVTSPPPAVKLADFASGLPNDDHPEMRFGLDPNFANRLGGGLHSSLKTPPTTPVAADLSLISPLVVPPYQLDTPATPPVTPIVEDFVQNPEEDEQKIQKFTAARLTNDPPVDEYFPQSLYCVECSTPVAWNDSITIDFQVFHNSCLRCSSCHLKLSADGYALLQGYPYCQKHFQKKMKEQKKSPSRLSYQRPA